MPRTTDTALEARAAGAVVRHEPLLGKGNVVRRMFADVEADVFVLVDGDDTYDAAASPAMLRLLVDAPAGHGDCGPGDAAAGGLPVGPPVRQ